MPIKVQEAHRTPNRPNQKTKPPQSIIIRILNGQNKERILKADLLELGFTSQETLKARRARADGLQTLRDHRCL